jgi:hypothetical protein
MLLLVGCGRAEYGPSKSESATVVDLPYVPDGHGSGFGVTSSGKSVLTSEDIPARYAVVFQCAHGRFAVAGADDRHRLLWSKLKVGDRVHVVYREEIKDGRPVGLDFLDATVDP